MEERIDMNDLGSTLEETIALNEKHQQFSQALTLQNDKIQHIAEFELSQLEESHPDWEMALINELLESLKCLNLLPNFAITTDIESTDSTGKQKVDESPGDTPIFG